MEHRKQIPTPPKPKTETTQIPNRKAIPITTPFIKLNDLRTRITYAITGKIPYPKLQQPIMLLMRNNGFMELLQNVQAGEFILQQKNNNVKKSILITPNKEFSWRQGNGEFIKTYVCHEDHMCPLPEDPLHNSEMFFKTTQKIIMNYKQRDETPKLLDAKGKFYLKILIGAGIILVLLFSSETFVGLIQNFFSPPPEPVINTVVHTATQIPTEVIVS